MAFSGPYLDAPSPTGTDRFTYFTVLIFDLENVFRFIFPSFLRGKAAGA